MRMFVGIILGVFLAVGIAYVHDSSLAAADRQAQAIVNWDALSSNVRGVSASLSAMWDRLTEGAQNVGDAVKKRT